MGSFEKRLGSACACVRNSAAAGAFELRWMDGAYLQQPHTRQDLHCGSGMSGMGSGRPRLPVAALFAWLIVCRGCVAFQAGGMLGKFPALRSGGGVTPLSQRNVRGGVMKRRPRPLRMCSSDLDGGGGGKEAPLTYFETFKKLPIIRR